MMHKGLTGQVTEFDLIQQTLPEHAALSPGGLLWSSQQALGSALWFSAAEESEAGEVW